MIKCTLQISAEEVKGMCIEHAMNRVSTYAQKVVLESVSLDADGDCTVVIVPQPKEGA